MEANNWKERAEDAEYELRQQKKLSLHLQKRDERARAERDNALSLMRAKEAEAAAATMRAEEAEAQRDALRADLDAIHRWLDDRADVEDPDQRPNAEMQMLSEFFEDQMLPAEPEPDSPASLAAQVFNEMTAEAEKPAETPAEPDEERDGDDVLREFLDEWTASRLINDMAVDSGVLDRTVAELCRRATGEER